LQLFVYSSFMEAIRNSWTDDRMDDLAGRVDAGFAEMGSKFVQVRVDRQFERVHDEFAEVRQETRDLGKELRAETNMLRGEMNQRFDSVDRRFDRLDTRFDVILGAMVAGFVGLIITHFVG
jgi:hypothetical protein